MLIQRRVLLPVQVQGIPAEWIWEIAVEGHPNDLSGMILNLVDLDRFMSEIKSEVENFQVPSPDEWLKSHELKFQAFLRDLISVRKSLSAGENIKLYWSRLESDRAEFGRRF
jgi:hypothetical protein